MFKLCQDEAKLFFWEGVNEVKGRVNKKNFSIFPLNPLPLPKDENFFPVTTKYSVFKPLSEKKKQKMEMCPNPSTPNGTLHSFFQPFP